MRKYLFLGVVSSLLMMGAGSAPMGDKGAPGDCYIMMGDNTVQQYDGVTGDLVGPFATDMINNVRDLTFGPNGNLFVLNNGSGTVEEYDGNTGDLIGTIVTDIVVGESMLFLPDETLLVSHLTPQTIEQYDTAANAYAPLGTWANGLEPLQNSMVLGPDGRVYVGDRLDNTVKAYDVDGANMTIFADGSGGNLTDPEGISFGGPNGNLFVASFTVDNVTEWDGVTGDYIGIFATDTDCPDGLRFAPDGKLWVSYVCSNDTKVYNDDGSIAINIVDGQSAPRSMTFKPEAQTLVVPYDIKPGSCPNAFNRKSKGVLPTALLGTADIDVMLIDETTIEMFRMDGFGGTVMPMADRFRYGDAAAPFDGEVCECAEFGPDGFTDLTMKFKTQEVVNNLELADFLPGDSVELGITGTLIDGTPFEAYDCLWLVPARVGRPSK